MESFIGAIVEDWHMFMDDTKRFDLFRNIFIIYNSTLDKSFDELKEKYGIESLLTNVYLHNHLENATSKKMLYIFINIIFLKKRLNLLYNKLIRKMIITHMKKQLHFWKELYITIIE